MTGLVSQFSPLTVVRSDTTIFRRKDLPDPEQHLSKWQDAVDDFAMFGAMITAMTLTLASIRLIQPDARLRKSNDMSRTIRISEENSERLEQLVGQKETTDDKAG